MGNFSYLYSDYNEYPNSKGGIEENENVALLIPKEFGGGNIIGKYDGYGNIISGKEKYSIGAINAIWNCERIRRILETDFGITGKLGIELNSDENLELLESIRYFGSLINDEIAVRLEYPVKIVRKKENIKKYEDYEFACIWDCDQGWGDEAFDEKRNIKPFGGYLKYVEYLKSVPVDDMLLENEISYGIFLDKARELKNGKLKAENEIISNEKYKEIFENCPEIDEMISAYISNKDLTVKMPNDLEEWASDEVKKYFTENETYIQFYDYYKKINIIKKVEFFISDVEEVKNRDGETQENEFVLYARLEIDGEIVKLKEHLAKNKLNLLKVLVKEKDIENEYY